jgi:hypothetical protein
VSARRTTAAALASLGIAGITGVAGIAGVAGSARADGPPADSGVERAAELAPGAIPDLAALGVELTPRAFATPSERTRVELHGYLRIREAALVNLDLDRGLDPSGQPLYPVPLAGGQVLDGGDLRARTDLAIYPRGTGVAIKARIDLLDNLAWGGTPEVGTGRSPTPAASAGQAAHTAIAIKRAWGEVLTPLGIFAAGRMGAHWGLGMAANGGDCEECDGGDAADRIALVTPLAGHFLALAWDLTSSGPFRRRAASDRPIDLEPSDDVTTVTAAWLRTASPATRLRRAAAGRPTFEYGVFASHRWQDRDVPADYLPVAGATPDHRRRAAHGARLQRDLGRRLGADHQRADAPRGRGQLRPRPHRTAVAHPRRAPRSGRDLGSVRPGLRERRRARPPPRRPRRRRGLGRRRPPASARSRSRARPPPAPATSTDRRPIRRATPPSTTFASTPTTTSIASCSAS